MKIGAIRAYRYLPFKAIIRINEVMFIKCLGPLTLSTGCGFLEMEAKLSRELKAWLKAKKVNSIEII